MVENLDLELSTSGILTPQDTDVSTNWDPYGKVAQNEWSTWAEENLGQSDQPAQYLAKGEDGNIWGTYFYDESGEKKRGEIVRNNAYSDIARSYANDYDYVAGTALDGTAYSYGSDSSWNAQHASTYYGHYYNWYAVTAESGTYTSMSANNSICAKGWQIPLEGDSSLNKSWMSLLNGKYNVSSESDYFNQLTNLPISLLRSGTYSTEGTLSWRNTHGYYWMPSVNGANLPFYLYFSNYGININHTLYNKSAGNAVRCVNKGSVREPVVATCAADHVCYNANGGTGTVEDQAVEAAQTPADTTATLAYSTNLSKDGYYFAGWSTTSTGYGDVYAAGESITVGDLSSTGKVLYAKWVKDNGTMQDFAAAKKCDTMSTGDSVFLKDARDTNTYRVTKLGDGNCWMTQNLMFTGTTLDFTTSDVADTYTPSTPLTMIYTDWKPLNALLEPRYVAGVDTENNPTVWYNYVAATAGTITGDTNADDAEHSICPSGWKLPSKSQYENFSNIDNIVNDFKPVMGGAKSYYGTENTSNPVDLNYSMYWSASARGGSQRYCIYYDRNGITTDEYAYHYNAIRNKGHYVRCVLRSE
jgi:uncharacterized protein (TIGR02145 family)/uncharacterized repeat protein (TIGR02543 family)